MQCNGRTLSFQRETMKQLAKYAKKKALLDSKQRQRFYQAGHFEIWFPVLFSILPKSINDIIPDLDNSKAAPTEEKVESIHDIIDQARARYGISSVVETISNTELHFLAEKFEAGHAEYDELIKLAKLYDQSGDTRAARLVTRMVEEDFPDNEK